MNNPMDKPWVPWALSGCGLLSLVCFIVIATVAISTAGSVQQPGGDPGIGTAPQTPTGGNVRAVTGVVQSVQFSRPQQSQVQVGQQCAFNVERHPHADLEYWCRAQIVCGGVMIYGGGNGGYFPCQWDTHGPGSIVGADLQTSGQDGDSAIGLNSTTGTLLVQDDRSGRLGEFRVQARLTGIR
jgi:hypothetical protein